MSHINYIMLHVTTKLDKNMRHFRPVLNVSIGGKDGKLYI